VRNRKTMKGFGYLFLSVFLFLSLPVFSDDDDIVNRLTWEFKGIKVWQFPSVIEVEDKQYLVIYKNFDSNIEVPPNPVHDFVELPKFPEGYQLVTGQCLLNNQYDEKIHAIVYLESNKEIWSKVLAAYDVDYEVRKIITLDHKKVSCMNDAWGI